MIDETTYKKNQSWKKWKQTPIDTLKEAFPTEDSCMKLLEELRWNNSPISPYYPKGIVNYYGNKRYRCRKTKRYFDAKTHTMFHSTRLPLIKWFIAIHLITSKKEVIRGMVSRCIEVSGTTAGLMMNRIHDCFKDTDFSDEPAFMLRFNKKIKHALNYKASSYFS